MRCRMVAALQDEHQKLHAQVQNCLQNIKIVRYDAFDAMGGEMSYSLLLTDANNKGVIMTKDLRQRGKPLLC